MANFFVICKTCRDRFLRSLDHELTAEEFESEILFETAHSINPTPKQLQEAMTCPRCDGQDCEKTFYGYDIVGYVRGNGYLDKIGVSREMNIHHLVEDDPYADYRVAGEVDDLRTRLRRAGQFDPHRKHYDTKVDQKPVVDTPKPTE